MRVTAVAIGFAFVAVACDTSESPPTIAFQYEVRGSGDDVHVTFFVPEAGLVDRIVRVPWASDELRATRDTPMRLEADGPSGSRVRCIVRYRPIEGVYGGNGSGSTTAVQNGPGEDHTVCSV
jgi:hypothetical protein